MLYLKRVCPCCWKQQQALTTSMASGPCNYAICLHSRLTSGSFHQSPLISNQKIITRNRRHINIKREKERNKLVTVRTIKCDSCMESNESNSNAAIECAIDSRGNRKVSQCRSRGWHLSQLSFHIARSLERNFSSPLFVSPERAARRGDRKRNPLGNDHDYYYY